MRGEGAEVASGRARRLCAVGARPRVALLGALSRDLVVQISELLLDERHVFGADEPVVSLVGLNRLLGFDHIGAQQLQLLGDRRAVLARGVGVQVADLVDVGLRGGVGELGGALGAARRNGDVEHERALGPPDLDVGGEGARGGRDRVGARVAARAAEQPKNRRRRVGGEFRILVERLSANDALDDRARRDDQRLAFDVIDEGVGILARRDRLGRSALWGAGVDVYFRSRNVFWSDKEGSRVSDDGAG